MEVLIDSSEVRVLYWEEYTTLSCESQRCAMSDLSDDSYFVTEYWESDYESA